MTTQEQGADRTLQLVDRFLPMMAEATAQSARLQGSVEALTKRIGETNEDLADAIRESTEQGSQERQEIRGAIKALLKETAAQTESKEATERERIKQRSAVALKVVALVGALATASGVGANCGAQGAHASKPIPAAVATSTGAP